MHNIDRVHVQILVLLLGSRYVFCNCFQGYWIIWGSANCIMVVFESSRFNFCLFPFIMCSDKYLETLKELPYHVGDFSLRAFSACWKCCRSQRKTSGIVHSIDIHPSRKHTCLVIRICCSKYFYLLLNWLSFRTYSLLWMSFPNW